MLLWIGRAVTLRTIIKRSQRFWHKRISLHRRPPCRQYPFTANVRSLYAHSATIEPASEGGQNGSYSLVSLYAVPASRDIVPKSPSCEYKSTSTSPIRQLRRYSCFDRDFIRVANPLQTTGKWRNFYLRGRFQGRELGKLYPTSLEGIWPWNWQYFTNFSVNSTLGGEDPWQRQLRVF